MRYSRPIRAIYEEAERVTPREEDGSMPRKIYDRISRRCSKTDAALDREVERIIAAQTEPSATPPDETISATSAILASPIGTCADDSSEDQKHR